MSKTVASSRADRLVKIRDLVSLGVNHRVTDRNELIKLAIEHEVFITEDKKRQYDYSSMYRYLAALLFLRFDLAESMSAPISWAPSAEALANASPESQYATILSEAEKRIFRDRIFTSKVNEQFLSSFCPSYKSPLNEELFRKNCKPLYILRVRKRPVEMESDPSWPSEKVVEIVNSFDSKKILRKAEMEFLYTYRLWCLDTDLIEEINVKEALRNGIPRELSYVLYPLSNENLLTMEAFLDKLYEFSGHSKQPVVVPIVKLFYMLCVDLRLKVDSFKDLLLKTWIEHRDLLHLERGPGVLIQGNVTSDEKSYRKRFGNHRYYLVVDGTIRTNLIIFPRS
jgi:hypothetical protein